MSPALLVLIGAVPAFGLGWLARARFDRRHTWGDQMDRPHSNLKPLDAIFAWFARGNRLIGLVVITAGIAVAAVAFTWVEGQQNDSREDRIYACIPQFISDFSATQASRTAASKVANDARRDWDRGYSEDPEARGMSKAELKARYLLRYSDYEVVAAENPTLPQFTSAYCDRVTR